MSKTLRWWLFFCISLTTMGIAHYFGMFAELYEKDVTKISFAIIGLYVFTSLYIGKLTLDKLVNTYKPIIAKLIYKFVYW